MANGTIAFDTLQTSGQIDGTARSIDTDYLLNGSAKAWLLATTDVGSIPDSFNISGSTDNGTGDYTFSFTNNMANENFSAQQSAAEDNVRTCVNKIRAVGSFRISFFDQNGSAQDAATSAGVHGELA